MNIGVSVRWRCGGTDENDDGDSGLWEVGAD